jgi:hypothetical protein
MKRHKGIIRQIQGDSEVPVFTHTRPRFTRTFESPCILVLISFATIYLSAINGNEIK